MIEESRKVQVTGGSTFMVSLPKKWVEKVGLEKGDAVDIVEREDHGLSIGTKQGKDVDRREEATLMVSDVLSPENVVRRVVAAYVMGSNVIRIKNASKRLDARQRYEIKDFTRRKLVGTEILSDVSDELTLQVLISYTDLPLKDTLRRMSEIAGSMHSDAIETLTSEDTQLAKEVISMDDEVDRFNLYVTRLLNAAVTEREVLDVVGLDTRRECLDYRLITKSVERMADHSVKIAENSLKLLLSDLTEDFMSEVEEMNELAFRVFQGAVDSLFAQDYSKAEEVLVLAEETREMEESVIQRIVKTAATEDVPSLRLIVESILRTSEYGSDIAEAVLNIAVKEEIAGFV